MGTTLSHRRARRRAHAQYFIDGGYSRLIVECVHRYGGITPISWEGKGNGEGDSNIS